MKFYSDVVNIGDINKKVVVINHEMKEKTEDSKVVDCVHHIHILDRSGSMSGEIYELIENVKTTIDFMDDNDFVSIIWFASAGQYKTLIKGARKDESLKVLLDSIKSTLGCTCFSDPLKEVGEIIEELGPICSNFNITLFTDGEPVTPWSYEEEFTKIMKAIDIYKDKVISINTVGYGYYYNEGLLTEISNKSEYGKMIHSSKINEYSNIFSHNYERIRDLIVEPVIINMEKGFVLYLNTTSSKLFGHNVHMNMLEKRKNQFFLIGNDDKDFEFEYQGQTYNTKDITTSISESTKMNLLYGFAYELCYDYQRLCALDILSKNIKDKFLIDQHMSSFTKDEIGEYMKNFKRCVFKPKYRFKDGECSENYIPREDALCVFDILHYLSNEGAQYQYATNYNRVGRKSEDSFNLFTWNPGPHLTPMNEIIFNDNELNVSIRSKIHGITKLNPKSAEKVGLENEVPSFVYRNQTIIKDGNLNMDTINIVFDKEGYQKFVNKFKDTELIYSIPEELEENPSIEITLSNLPIINRTYSNINTDADYILNKLEAQNNKSLEMKVINYLLDPLFEKAGSQKYTDEQLEVLAEHGVGKDGCYGGVKIVTAEKNEEDFYIARQMQFSIKGSSSLPSVNSVLKKVDQEKKLNINDTFIMNTIQKYEAQIDQEDDKATISFLYKIKKELEKDIMDIKFDLCIGKMSAILTGGWIKKVEALDNDKYSYTNQNDKTLIVTAKKVKKYL